MNPDDAIPQPRPDRSVLMLIADDWSPIAGCYGDTLARTPNIDKFAESATVFDHAYCTSPSCAASRANLLTGLYSHTHGQYGHSHFPFGFTTHPHVQTLPAVLKAAGGFSGLGGKNHTAPRDLYPYDLFVGNGWLTDRIAQTTAESLRRGAGKPTFVMGASLFPHRAKIRDLDNDFYLPDDAWRPDPADVAVPDWLPDAPAVRDDLSAYYGAIERFDHFVGANLAALEASGRAEQTLVILLSDHGLPFPFAKASSFEAGLHCPLLIRRPGGQGQHTDALANWCDVTRTVYDWLGLTVPEGVWFEDRPKPEQPALPGRSLHPLLEPDADAADWHTTHFSHTCHETNNHYPFRGCINRHGNRRLKYVEHVVDPGTTLPLPTDLFASPTFQHILETGTRQLGKRTVDQALLRPRRALYDLDADPLEIDNLIDDPAHADHVERLRTASDEMRRWTGDVWLDYGNRFDQTRALLDGQSA